MEINLGRIKLVWRGDYVASTAYAVDDLVHYNGSTYVCVTPTNASSFDPADWELFASGSPEMDIHGQILYRGSSATRTLNPGVDGQVLTTRGYGANPQWTFLTSRPGTTVAALPASGGCYRSAGALMSDGTLSNWGTNVNGQLGVGDTSIKSAAVTPLLPKTSANITKWVTQGSSNWVLFSDGKVYSWGYNLYGQLGLGDTVQRLLPTEITALANESIVDIVVGHSANRLHASVFFRSSTGKVFSCGYNAYGQLGLNDTNDRNTPTQLGKTDFASIVVAGTRYTSVFGIDTNNNLFSWGYNTSGELGLGNTTDTLVPVQVNLPAGVAQVSSTKDDSAVAGVQTGGHTIIKLIDGRVYTFGRGNEGQLGLNTTTSFSSPQQVPSLGNTNQTVHAFGGHDGFSVVVKTDGSIRVFGANTYGQLGLNSITDVLSPTEPSGTSGRGGLRKLNAVGTGGYSALVLLYNNGDVLVAGNNSNGRLGVGTTANEDTFVVVPFQNAKIVDFVSIGINTEAGIGFLSDDGVYYQTGYSGGSQLGYLTASSLVPHKIVF